MEPVYVLSALILLALLFIMLVTAGNSRPRQSEISDADHRILLNAAIAWLRNTSFGLDGLAEDSPTDGQLHEALEGLREKIAGPLDLARVRQQLTSGIVPGGLTEAENRLLGGLIKFGWSDFDILDLLELPYTFIEKDSVIKMTAR